MEPRVIAELVANGISDLPEVELAEVLDHPDVTILIVARDGNVFYLEVTESEE